jgi:hypothetical protein
MKSNIGALDGAIRVAAFAYAISFVILTGSYAWILIPTAFLFVTAALEWSPLYAMLGINTDTKKSEEEGTATQIHMQPRLRSNTAA